MVIISEKHNYPIKTPKKVFRIIYVLFNRLSVLYTKIQSVFYAGRFETYKIMHTGKGLLVAVAFYCGNCIQLQYKYACFSSTELFLKDYYEEYGGELDDAVL